MSDDIYQPYVDETDEPTDADDASGTTPASLSLPDEAPRMQLVQEIATATAKAIEDERRFYNELGSANIVKANTNISGSVLFASFGYTAGQSPIQIVREKRERGDLVIVNYTAGVTLYVGLHAGILVGGTDTARVVGIATGSSRTIRTRQALWAVADGTCTFDVQEEWD